MSNSKFFIEVGTSDFNTLEPLAEQGWNGIFIEPDNWYLKNLKRYDGCHYEQVAISNYRGTSKFYAFDGRWVDDMKNEDEQWIRGTGNIDDTNAQNMNPDWPQVEFDDEVCMLQDIVDKHSVKKIDFLKIDAEGNDYDIIQGYDFRVRPTLIKIESEHLHHRTNVKEFKQYIINELQYAVHQEERDWWLFNNQT